MHVCAQHLLVRSCDDQNMFVVSTENGGTLFDQFLTMRHACLCTAPVGQKLGGSKHVVSNALLLHADPCRELEWHMFLAGSRSHPQHDELRLNRKCVEFILDSPHKDFKVIFDSCLVAAKGATTNPNPSTLN